MAVIDFRFVYRDGAASGSAVSAYKLADTKAELPSAVEGDLGYAKDKDSLYYHNGTLWVPVGEEGDWTPHLTGSGGGSTQTFTTQNGRWAKVGRLVVITGFVNLATKGNISGNVIVNNLPFTVIGTHVWLGIVEWGSLLVAKSFINCTFGQGTTNVNFFALAGNATSSNTSLSDTDIQDGTNLRFSGSYLAS